MYFTFVRFAYSLVRVRCPKSSFHSAIVSVSISLASLLCMLCISILCVCFGNEKPNNYHKLRKSKCKQNNIKRRQQQQQSKIWHIPNGCVCVLWASLSVTLFRYSLSYFICVCIICSKLYCVLELSFFILFYFIFVMCDVIHSFEKETTRHTRTHTQSQTKQHTHAHRTRSTRNILTLTLISYMSYDYFKIKTQRNHLKAKE